MKHVLGFESVQRATNTRGFRRLRDVTEMFLLLGFKELDSKRYESHAYRTDQHWFNRDFFR